MENPKKKQNLIVIAIAIGLGILWLIVAHFRAPENTTSTDTHNQESIEPNEVSKETWTQSLIEELNIQKEYIDSVIPRAKRTSAPAMLKGYVLDMRKIANKTISDSLFMDVYSSNEVADLMESNSKNAKKILPQLTKIWRAEYAKQIKEKLWEENIDVVTSNGGTTITFIGGLFASHKNIKQWQEEIGPGLEEMGFKRVQYKWIPSASEYTYYDLTPNE